MASADTLPLGWTIAIAILVPSASLAGAWLGVYFAGTRQQYADEAARHASFVEAKREAYSSLVAAIATLRREPTETNWTHYYQRREAALGYAKGKLEDIFGLLGEDPRHEEFDVDKFRSALYSDEELR